MSINHSDVTLGQTIQDPSAAGQQWKPLPPHSSLWIYSIYHSIVYIKIIVNLLEGVFLHLQTPMMLFLGSMLRLQKVLRLMWDRKLHSV